MSSSSSTTLAVPPIPAGALLYQRATTNPIGVTAATSTNIGYLTNNISQLEVVSQLTPQDKTAMYNFTYQNTGPVTLTLRNVDGTAPVRIQLLDGSGSRVLADSGGNAQLQQAYANLTSSAGLNLSNGKYIVSVSYSSGGDKTQPQNYGIQIDSGTTFKNDYRTLAAATTVQNTLLAGGNLGYNSLSSTAAMLANEANGTSIDIFGVLSLFNTNIFA
jgi:flagellar hook assembly protein FlgD